MPFVFCLAAELSDTGKLHDAASQRCLFLSSVLGFGKAEQQVLAALARCFLATKARLEEVCACQRWAKLSIQGPIFRTLFFAEDGHNSGSKTSLRAVQPPLFVWMVDSRRHFHCFGPMAQADQTAVRWVWPSGRGFQDTIPSGGTSQFVTPDLLGKQQLSMQTLADVLLR